MDVHIRLQNAAGQRIGILMWHDFTSLLALQQSGQPVPGNEDQPPEGQAIITLTDRHGRKVGTAKQFEINYIVDMRNQRGQE